MNNSNYVIKDIRKCIFFTNTKFMKLLIFSETMSEPELQLDPAIRVWVFLPIVMITFLIGVLRHYVSVLLSSQKKVKMQIFFQC